MPCYHPIKAWRGRTISSKGKAGVVFKRELADPGTDFQVPCGRCIGCRLERSRQWAVRIMHEVREHEQNCFVTLTYSEQNLPEDGGLRKKDFQDFMKRYRKWLWENKRERIRFFHCGEYGEKGLRPHYHAIIFGHDFEDKKLYKVERGVRHYVSDDLSNLWGLGFCVVGAATFESAAYVARYCMKKVTGEKAEKVEDGKLLAPYERLDIRSGEILKVSPEYCTMSRRPGIGASFYSRYKDGIYPWDEIVFNGHKMKPPRYYDNLYEQEGGDVEVIKSVRKKWAIRRAHENTPERLAAKKAVKIAAMSQIKRDVV